MANIKSIALGGLSLAAVPAMNAQENHPNVVYIMTDQQSYYMISALSSRLNPEDPYAGNPYVSTPNLDRLVNSGYTFSNCYAAHPVSGPSRYALLTASSPNHYGMTGNFSPGGEKGMEMKENIAERSMGVLFRNAGYRTFYAGKVHLPWANGTSGHRSIYEPPYHYGFDEYLTGDDREKLAEVSSKFFSEYKDDDPFLFFVSFMNPHDICMTQVLFNDKQLEDFKTDEIDRRARINQIEWRETFRRMDRSRFDTDELASIPENLARTDVFPYNKSKNQFQLTEHNIRVHRWFYYSLMHQVDQQIGQVLDALENSVYKDNTIIVFTSDHGELGCSHGLTGKNYPYQECQRVPLIFAGKNIPQGVVDKENVICNGWDMLPTMLDLAGLDVPDEFRGESFKKAITGGRKVNRKYVYLETVNSYGILEEGRYKYIRFGGAVDPSSKEAEVLFDLKNDPGELHNLASDPAYKKKMAELRKALDKEMRRFDTSFDVFKNKKK